jgi:two-component system, response regulator YesN
MRLVIADDEEMARFMLRSMLEDLGAEFSLEILGEAKNGAELLDLVDEKRPDAVFVDIKMPMLDGLEAIRKGRERFPETDWIILTGFSEFEYAREAVRIGAANYLLKPTKPDELRSALLALIGPYAQKIQSRGERLAEDLTRMQYSAEQNSGEVRIPVPPAPSGKPDSGYIGCLVALDGVGVGEASAELRRNLAALHERYWKTGLPAFTIETKGGNILALLPTIHSPAPSAERGEYASAVRTAVSASKGGGAGTVIAFEKSEDSNLARTIDDLDSLAGLRVLLGVGVSYNYEELSSVSPKLRSLGSLCTKFISLCNSRDYLAAIAIIGRMEKWNAEFSPLPDPVRRSNLKAYLNRFWNISTESSETIPAILSRLRSRCESRLDESSGKTDVVDEAISFIEGHFMENIGIKTLADRLDISPNYLSTLFRRRTGRKFIEYLAEARILHSKKLLRENPAMPVAQIAVLVGYPSSRYFARQFLRLVDCYPSEYRKK